MLGFLETFSDINNLPDRFFEILTLTYGPGQLIILKNEKSNMASGPYLKSTLLQEHIGNMLLEQSAFQIWSWSIFDLENSFRLLMVRDHFGPGAYGPGAYGPGP